MEGILKQYIESLNLIGLNFAIYDNSTIRKSYREAAKGAHPDKGGSEEKFNAVKAAQDFLLKEENLTKLYHEIDECKSQEEVILKNLSPALDISLQSESDVLVMGEVLSDFGVYDFLG